MRSCRHHNTDFWQRCRGIIREVSERRQAAIDFSLGPVLEAASIAIGSRIVLAAYGVDNDDESELSQIRPHT